MELHWIQRHVLLQLIRSKTLSVQRLRPDNVEANLFSYYLAGLVRMGLVVKIARGMYGLTNEGEAFVGTFSTTTQRLTKEIKTVVMLWAERDDNVLFFCWSRQPYLNKITLPYDRMPRGKSLEEGIDSVLREKIGISEASIEYVASALIRIEKENVLISHMNALVYKIDASEIKDGFTGKNGYTVWANSRTPGVMAGVTNFLSELRAGNKVIESVWEYTD